MRKLIWIAAAIAVAVTLRKRALETGSRWVAAEATKDGLLDGSITSNAAE
jgi:hypothetical protein